MEIRIQTACVGVLRQLDMEGISGQQYTVDATRTPLAWPTIGTCFAVGYCCPDTASRHRDPCFAPSRLVPKAQEVIAVTLSVHGPPPFAHSVTLDHI